MTSQVEGLNQAIRNANDGAALIQTAEGGLEETTNILQRMRELSIQSANGTYDTGNRTTLNAEVEQLQAEIDRIAETTSFNGLSILDGSLGQVDLQVGENANQTIALNIGSLNTNNLGASGADLVGAASNSGNDLFTDLATIDGTNFTVNGDQVADLSAGDLSADTLAKVVSLLDESIAGVDVSTFVELEADLAVGGNGALSGDDELLITVAMADGSADREINIKNTTDMQDLVDKINAEGGDTVQASINDDGQLVLFSEVASTIEVNENGDGLANSGFAATVTQNAQLKFEITDSSIESIDVGGDGAIVSSVGLNLSDDGAVAGATAQTVSLSADQLVINGVSIAAATGADIADTLAAINRHSGDSGVIALEGTLADSIKLVSVDGKGVKIEAGDGFVGTQQEKDELLQTNLGLTVSNEAESTSSTVASIDISTAEGAQRAIGILDEAIQQVSEVRGDLGAISNRLDYTTSNLANISENAASARSQIMDADFAEESANLSRAQVLQQAGNAMLAQANSRPQQVLSLLQ
jgi:flagellin